MADEANGALPDWMSFEPEDHGARWCDVYDEAACVTALDDEKFETPKDKDVARAKIVPGKFEVQIDWISRRKQQAMMAPAAVTLAGGALGLRRDEAPDPEKQIESVAECQRKVLRSIVRSWKGLSIDIYNSMVDPDDRIKPSKSSDALVTAENKRKFEEARTERIEVPFSEPTLERLLVTALPDRFSSILFAARDAWAGERDEVEDREQPDSPTTSEA